MDVLVECKSQTLENITKHPNAQALISRFLFGNKEVWQAIVIAQTNPDFLQYFNIPDDVENAKKLLAGWKKTGWTEHWQFQE